MIHVEQRSETGTNVDFTEYTMKNDENDACFDTLTDLSRITVK
jgi:hypothetical protein